MDRLTDQVRFVAVKADLENLTKTALTELSHHLLEMFHGIISDLIKISRNRRQLNTVVN